MKREVKKKMEENSVLNNIHNSFVFDCNSAKLKLERASEKRKMEREIGCKITEIFRRSKGINVYQKSA